MRLFFRSEENRSQALFHDCHHEDECISENRLELALKYLSQVLCVLSVESLVMYETPPLVFGILPWFECVLAAVIPVILVSFQSSYKWFKKQTQGKQLQSLRTFLDDKIFQLETIAYKDQPTKEECLTCQIELPGLHVFARELKELANELHPGLGNVSSILYKTKLISIQNAMSDYISKHFPTCTCDCPKSDCWAQKEHKRLLGLSEKLTSRERNPGPYFQV